MSILKKAKAEVKEGAKVVDAIRTIIQTTIKEIKPKVPVKFVENQIMMLLVAGTGSHVLTPLIKMELLKANIDKL
jgi:hypothetical protein